MSEYKKAKHRRKKFFKKKKQIFMKPNNGSSVAENYDTEKSQFRVISGKKELIKKRNYIVLSVVFLLIVVLLVFSLLSPTGIIETSSNYISGISIRDYFPSDFEGNELFSVNSMGNHFYVLSNQTLTSYNLSGKRLFEQFHGCEKPVVALSETRALLFDQNGTNVSIFNANGNILNVKTEFPIYTADISRNGFFAVASKAQSYTSAVTVYDDKGKLVYEWFSPEEIITAVALSPNGKQLAVCGIKTVNGVFVSNVYIFEFNAVEPVWRQTYNDIVFYDMISEGYSYFCVVSQNKCEFINWKEHSIVSHTTDNNIHMIRSNGNKTVICEPHSSDTYKNKFTVYGKKSEVLFQYDFSGYVDDFAFKNNSLYVLSGNSIYRVNKDSEIASSAECNFGTVRLVPSSTEKIIAVSESSLSQIHFK